MVGRTNTGHHLFRDGRAGKAYRVRQPSNWPSGTTGSTASRYRAPFGVGDMSPLVYVLRNQVLNGVQDALGRLRPIGPP